MSKMLIIGIAGGSGSGKSTFADLVVSNLDDADLAVIRHDSFYKPLGHLSLEERKRANFDHPDSLDTALMIDAIKGSNEENPFISPITILACTPERPPPPSQAASGSYCGGHPHFWR